VGLRPGKVVHLASGDPMILNLFVMVPHGRLKGEYLDGYRIRKYPSLPYKQLRLYKPPRGFIKVTRENEDALVSPYFTLGQSVGKQQPDRTYCLKGETGVEAGNDSGKDE